MHCTQHFKKLCFEKTSSKKYIVYFVTISEKVYFTFMMPQCDWTFIFWFNLNGNIFVTCLIFRGWVDDEMDVMVKTVSRRIAAILDLDLKSAESFQVIQM